MTKLDVNHEYEAFVGVRIPCAEAGCKNIITNYAIKKGAKDRRVWCLNHRYLSQRSGSKS